MTETGKYDAIIIGAGIHGTSLAFHLAERGLKPVVLERRFLGAGATGRSSGLVRMHYDLEPESRLAWASFQYFKEWGERVGGECGFTRTGFIQIVKRDHQERLRANVAMHQQIGIPALVVTSGDVSRLAPGLYTGDFDIAAYEPESGYADPSSSARSFMDAAVRRGARLVQNCQVLEVQVHGGLVKGVSTTRGNFAAPVVVNAAGAWASRIGRMAGLELPVDTWQHDTMFIRRPDALKANHPTVIDYPNEVYFRPETGGLTLVGLVDGNPIGEDPEGGDERARPGFVERAAERICRRFPGMEHGSLQGAHGGYDGITPDQRAILDQAGPEGFFLVCGFSGTGFKIAPAVGACMAERILNGEARTVDIRPFRLGRFSEGAHLEGKHGYDNVWS